MERGQSRMFLGKALLFAVCCPSLSVRAVKTQTQKPAVVFPPEKVGHFQLLPAPTTRRDVGEKAGSAPSPSCLLLMLFSFRVSLQKAQTKFKNFTFLGGKSALPS